MGKFLAGFFAVFVILIVIVTLFGCDDGIEIGNNDNIKTTDTEITDTEPQGNKNVLWQDVLGTWDNKSFNGQTYYIHTDYRGAPEKLQTTTDTVTLTFEYDSKIDRYNISLLINYGGGVIGSQAYTGVLYDGEFFQLENPAAPLTVTIDPNPSYAYQPTLRTSVPIFTPLYNFKDYPFWKK